MFGAEDSQHQLWQQKVLSLGLISPHQSPAQIILKYSPQLSSYFRSKFDDFQLESSQAPVPDYEISSAQVTSSAHSEHQFKVPFPPSSSSSTSSAIISRVKFLQSAGLRQELSESEPSEKFVIGEGEGGIKETGQCEVSESLGKRTYILQNWYIFYLVTNHLITKYLPIKTIM